MNYQFPTDLFENKKVGILGVGVEGRATIDYLLSHGVQNIEALDKNVVPDLPIGVTTAFGEAYLDGLGRFDVLFRSPGFRPDLPALVSARESGTRITSAVSFFLEHCPAKTIGITGTVGKGTASSLTAAALEKSGLTVHLGGNIGKSPLTFLDDIRATDVVVLELSSFQTMDLSTSPSLGCILKTTTEHLDWHVDTEEYRSAKAHLLHTQTPQNAVVYNADSEGSQTIAQSGRGRKIAISLRRPVEDGIFLNNDRLVLRLDGRETVLPIEIGKVRLAGRFNLENIAAAVVLAWLAGGDINAICDAVTVFEGLPHRLQLAAASGEVRFFNDSYATRPDAAMAAISAFSCPMALIMGGSEKNADFAELFDFMRSCRHIHSLTLIGATAQRMREELTQHSSPPFAIRMEPTLEAAMKTAASSLPGQGVVLMTPACASFGLFKNYKERGEQFVALARQMASASPV